MTAPAAQQRYWLGDSPEIGHLLAQAESSDPPPPSCSTAPASRPAQA
jgi:hypothetical protein